MTQFHKTKADLDKTTYGMQEERLQPQEEDSQGNPLTVVDQIRGEGLYLAPQEVDDWGSPVSQSLVNACMEQGFITFKGMDPDAKKVVTINVSYDAQWGNLRAERIVAGAPSGTFYKVAWLPGKGNDPKKKWLYDKSFTASIEALDGRDNVEEYWAIKVHTYFRI